MGRPASPFIGEGEGAGYRERKGEKREEGLQGHRILLLLHAGPADAVDGDGGGSTSGSCSPLVPCPGVISWSWRPQIPSSGIPNTDTRHHGSSQILKLLPSPILQSIPCFITSKPLSTLRQVYDIPAFGLASSTEVLAKYLALNTVTEPPNLMPPRSACLPLDTKHSRKNTKLLGSIEHTPWRTRKSTFLPSGSQMRE